jgi:hypothetical protein
MTTPARAPIGIANVLRNVARSAATLGMAGDRRNQRGRSVGFTQLREIGELRIDMVEVAEGL